MYVGSAVWGFGLDVGFWFVLDRSTGPVARAWAAATTVSNAILVFGGSSQDAMPLSDLWRYKADEQRWQLLTTPTTPVGVSAGTMVTIGTTVVLFGGEAFVNGSNV